MAEFLINQLRSDTGDLTFYTAQPWVGPPRPVVLFIHGALRSANELAHWADNFEGLADVALLDMPGHGRSQPIFPATFDAMVNKIVDGIRVGLAGRDVVLVGESLGGLMALAIGGRPDAGPVRAVLAADPPITTKKLLHVHRNFQNVIAQTKEPAFLESFAFETLGIAGTSAEDRIYYSVFDDLHVPAKIVAGDRELFPLRARDDIAILFDKVDQSIVERFYGDKVTVHRIEDSGHLVLVDRVGPCLEHIKSLLADVVADREALAAK